MRHRKIMFFCEEYPAAVLTLLILASGPVLGGCAHLKNEDTVLLTDEKKIMASQIDNAQFEGRLTPTEAYLRKDSLRNNIKF